jgi:hypothetical protein
MSVKERLHHLIEALPDTDLLVAERMLRGLTLPFQEEPVAFRHRPTPEELSESLERLRAVTKGHVSTEAYLREKYEDIEREDARQRQRRESHPE